MLNSYQARWLIQLAPYDFTIHYRKGKLNPANGPSCHPDYAAEEPDTTITKLIPTLRNKLEKDSLATISSGTSEQVSVQGSDPCAVSLIQAVLS